MLAHIEIVFPFAIPAVEGMTTAPPSRLVSILGEQSGIGLTGMQERVRELGGCLGLISDDRGTAVSVVMPILLPTSDLGVKSL